MTVKNIMVFSLLYDSNTIAIGIYENMNRPADLEDFEYISQKYYEPKDKRKVVWITICDLSNIFDDEHNRDVVSAVFENVLESRSDINYFVRYISDDELKRSYFNSEENYYDFISNLNKYCRSNSIVK